MNPPTTSSQPMQLRSRSPSRYRECGIRIGRATANSVASANVSTTSQAVVDHMDDALLAKFKTHLVAHSYKAWRILAELKMEDHWRIALSYTENGNASGTMRNSAFMDHIGKYSGVTSIQPPTDLPQRPSHIDYVFLNLSSANAGMTGALQSPNQKSNVRLITKTALAGRLVVVAMLSALIVCLYVYGLRVINPDRYY